MLLPPAMESLHRWPRASIPTGFILSCHKGSKSDYNAHHTHNNTKQDLPGASTASKGDPATTTEPKLKL